VALNSLISSGGLHTVALTHSNKGRIGEGPDVGSARALGGHLLLGEYVAFQGEGGLSFSSVHGGLLEGLAKYELYFGGLDGGRSLHGVGISGKGEAYRGLHRIAHLTHDHTHTQGLHELIEVLAVGHVVVSNDLVGHGDG